METSKNLSSQAGRAVRGTEHQGRRLEGSKIFGALVMIGLVAYGVVHLLVAWIALQIAWTGGGGEASQQGAFSRMAASGLGDVLLWVTAVGLFTLVLWQVFTALWGHGDQQDRRKRLIKRLGSLGKAVVYLAIGISATSTAAGRGKSGNSGEKTITARLLGVPFGRVVVIAVGVVVLVIGGRLIYRGVKKKFTKDLIGGVSRSVVLLGQIGYCAKGIALGIVGVLFVVAAVTFDPNKAGGLDTALRTLRDQPFGAVLLALMALGLAAFGVYCFSWSRHAKV